jgi:hypothetical protein
MAQIQAGDAVALRTVINAASAAAVSATLGTILPRLRESFDLQQATLHGKITSDFSHSTLKSHFDSHPLLSQPLFQMYKEPLMAQVKARYPNADRTEVHGLIDKLVGPLAETINKSTLPLAEPAHQSSSRAETAGLSWD